MLPFYKCFNNSMHIIFITGIILSNTLFSALNDVRISKHLRQKWTSSSVGIQPLNVWIYGSSILLTDYKGRNCKKNTQKPELFAAIIDFQVTKARSDKVSATWK